MKSILVIDDDKDFRDKLSDLFVNSGFEVQTAVNGLEGERKFRANPNTLVLLELFMPEQDGLETIMNLRKDFPGAKIVAMTGNQSNINIRKSIDDDFYLSVAKGLGADAVFEKPFEMENLLNTVVKLAKQV